MAILDPFTVGLPVKFGLCTFTLFPWDASAPQGNKVNGRWTFYSSLSDLEITIGEETIEKIVNAMVTHSTLYCVVNSATSGNADIYPAAYGTLSIVKEEHYRVVVKYYAYLGDVIWVGQYYDTLWKGWKQLATTETPQEYDLPLGPNVSAQSVKYFKDGCGKVGVNGVFSFNAAPSAAQLIGTLPMGFRPSSSKSIILQSDKNDSMYGYIHSNGQIVLANTTPTQGFTVGRQIAIVSPSFTAAK